MRFEEWEEKNNHFLAGALSWLRQRLESVAQQNSDPATSQDPALLGEKKVHLKDNKGRHRDKETYFPGFQHAEGTDTLPALLVLRHRFNLSDFEMHILLLCIAMELDARMALLCARAQGHQSFSYPTFALAMSVFEKATWDVLSPERPLRQWKLLEIIQAGNQSLIMSPLKADERIVHFVKGLNYLDERLSAYLVPMPLEWGDQGDFSEKRDRHETAITDEITHDLMWEWQAGRRPVVNLWGVDLETKLEVAAKVAQTMGNRLYRLPTEWVPSQVVEIENLVRLWQRESLLLNVGLMIEATDLEKTGAGEGQISGLNRILTKTAGLVFLLTRDMWSHTFTPILQYEVTRPTSEVQYQTWIQVLGQYDVQKARDLSAQFRFSISTIRRLARQTLERASKKENIPNAGIWEACLNAARPNLDKLAQRLEPKATWEDLVLPENEIKALRQIVSQVRHRSLVYRTWGFAKKMNRGLGISVMFAGESGTGKTMAAEVIANDLGLNLYRIDLSGVVSKYIGETEKNLRRVFDAAEDGGAILFFDEADALFGKRSEVKDSHDRYANIEVNYLLQRLEAYQGLAILATNMKQAMDSAFVRRLRFIVNFPFPSRKERKAIWSHALPPEVPQEGVDMERLSRFTLTGGNIHAIALQTAFLAASNGGQVTMPHVLAAIKDELRKHDRPIVETEFQ